MTLREILGILFVALPFLGIGLVLIRLDGWFGLKVFLLAALVTSLIVGSIALGMFLLTGYVQW